MYNFTDEEIVSEKLEQARQLMDSMDVDLWLIVDSEGRDPALSLVVGGATSGRTVYAFDRAGNSWALTSWPDMGHVESLGVFGEVIPTNERGAETELRQLYEEIQPDTFMLNWSKTDQLCDGLSHGSYRWLIEVLGEKEVVQKAVSSQPLLTQLRAVKSELELRRIRAACEHNLAIYREVQDEIQQGMTEKQIQQLFRTAIERRTDQGVMPQEGPLVLLPKAGMSHREPTDARLAAGDLLVCDFGLGYRGYHSDIARTFYCCHPHEDSAPQKILDAFGCIREAIQKAFEAMKPGVPGYEVDAAARNHLLDNGYPDIKHSVGHQVGQMVHDGGTALSSRKGKDSRASGGLQENEVYAVEPTILEGELSIITEENVRVTEDGAEKLHQWQNELWYV